jgi:hypothetical protein
VQKLIEGELKTAQSRLEGILASDLAAINDTLRTTNAPILVVRMPARSTSE